MAHRHFNEVMRRETEGNLRWSVSVKVGGRKLYTNLLIYKMKKKNKYKTGMVRVENSIKKRLKIECAKRGITMSKLLEKIIKEYL